MGTLINLAMFYFIPNPIIFLYLDKSNTIHNHIIVKVIITLYERDILNIVHIDHTATTEAVMFVQCNCFEHTLNVDLMAILH